MSHEACHGAAGAAFRQVKQPQALHVCLPDKIVSHCYSSVLVPQLKMGRAAWLTCAEACNSRCTDCREILSGLAQENPTWLSNFSAQFNAVLVMDDYGLTFGPEFAPEGNDYVPRIIFADPDGSVRSEVGRERHTNAPPKNIDCVACDCDGHYMSV